MCYVAKSGIVLAEKLIYVMAFENKVNRNKKLL